MREKWKSKRHIPKYLASMMVGTVLAIILILLDIFEMGTVKAIDVSLMWPRIIQAVGMESGQVVTWDCVWFGTYPQAEIIPSGVEYTALDKSLLREGDVIVSDDIYGALQSAAAWDDNNEITLDGVKYRRINKGDATNLDGSYQWIDSISYHYFKYEPIKWRVLYTDGNQALLLSDISLDNQQYNTVKESVSWETCTIRSWLNGYDAACNQRAIDYSSKNFIDSAFSASEQANIADSVVENADNITYGTDGGSDTVDKIYLLSEAEVWNTEEAVNCGFARSEYVLDEARRCKSSTYAKAMGVDSLAGTGECMWFLRTPGYEKSSVMDVDDEGGVWDDGAIVNNTLIGIRMALVLNLSSDDFYTYAGTVCSDGTIKEEGKDLEGTKNEESPSFPQGGNKTVSENKTDNEAELSRIIKRQSRLLTFP